MRVYGIEINATIAERLYLKMKACIDVKINTDHYVCTFANHHSMQLACHCCNQGDMQIPTMDGQTVYRNVRTEMVSEIPTPQERTNILDQLEAHKDLEAILQLCL